MQKKFFITFIIFSAYISFANNVYFYQNFFSKGDLVFDIGANIGKKTDIYLSEGAQVVCVEPLPECCQLLRSKYQDNKKVTIVETGLAEKPGFLELFVCSSSNAISTFSQEWVSSSRFSTTGYKWDRKIKVPISTLDELIAKYGIPQYCKIDVENYELSVLKGLTQPIPFISIEFAIETIHNTKKCINHLVKMGYEEFNFALGETPRLILERWVNQQELIEIIEIKSKYNKEIWGDIYARYDIN